MSDILLIFSPDKKPAAQLIRDALNGAGYRAALREVTVAEARTIPDSAGGSAATLLVWSRALASAADADGWLPSLRRHGHVIEISTDSIAPQSGDESRVILLSGWRGQPYHLGWKRVLGAIERLGAERGTAAPTPAAPAAAAAPEREAPVRAAAGGKGRRLAWPAAAALALAGTVAAAAWIGTRPADSRDAAPKAAPVIISEQETPEAAPPLQAAPEQSPQSGATVAPAPPVPVQPAQAVPAPRPASADAKPAAKRAAAPPRASKTRAAAGPLPIKRYSKKNSKTMRRFCARAGRSTRECRIFLRSTAAARRS